MIQVVELSPGSLEISWDENDPKESILNYFTEKDFLDTIETYLIENMSPIDKITTMLNHIESIIKLISGNKYEMHIYQRLISIKVELQRQLSLLNDGKTIS